TGDWSSDVCSSDLTLKATPANSPTALPISMAPASNQGRGSGITVPRVLRLPGRRAHCGPRVGHDLTALPRPLAVLVICTGDHRRGREPGLFVVAEDPAARQTTASTHPVRAKP